MHTFFINTSGKKVDNYPEILEIHRENAQFISLDCPLKAWETGCGECVKKIGEMIDNYKDINNSYNLIVYIDLIDFDKYLSERINMHSDRERTAALYVMYRLIRHYVRRTLYDSLADIARKPHETLIIFEENPRPADDKLCADDVRACLLDFLGLPSVREISEFCAGYDPCQCGKFDIGKFSEDFKRTFASHKNGELVPGIGDCYAVNIDAWIEELAGCIEDPITEATKHLAAGVETRDTDDSYSIGTVCFATNRTANDINRRERARRDIRLYLYLLDCIETETLFAVGGDGTKAGRLQPKELPQLSEDAWGRIGGLLNKKCAVYNELYSKIFDADTDFSKLKLAPELVALDHNMFGYDEHAGLLTDLIYEDYDITQPQKKQGAGNSSLTGGITVSEERRQIPSVLEDFAPFEGYDGAPEPPKINAKDARIRYREEADKLRRHHIDLLPKLSGHVSDSLADYAARSVEGRPAKLSKRRVSVADENLVGDAEERRYNRTGTRDGRALVTVKNSAKAFYDAALKEYLEFCAARSVAITDIEKQYAWFIERVDGIAASLKRIVKVGTILAIAALILYIPFWVIQWELISGSVLTLAAAIASTVIPLAILTAVTVVMSLRQRKKYREAWLEFKSKSDEVLADNVTAMKQFDRLLAIIIPSLRYIYEFKLDVEFTEQCHRMLSAKRDHHSSKLYRRIETIGNILEDLDLEFAALHSPQSEASALGCIEFGCPFCIGDKNIKLYSVFDEDMKKQILG